MPSGFVTGFVTGFDEQRGLGTVTSDDGTSYLFHCIEIADGTRKIDVGAPVTFRQRPKFGRFEAAELRKV